MVEAPFNDVPVSRKLNMTTRLLFYQSLEPSALAARGSTGTAYSLPGAWRRFFSLTLSGIIPVF
jgi:hypothetical protein